jgi:hypothetical protein
MATPTKTVPNAIGPDQWTKFLAEFTRDNRGAHARLEVLGTDPGRVVVTDDRHFEGISADSKDGERNVWITFSDTPGDHFTHSTQSVTAILVRPPTESTGPALEIEAKDGTRTLLLLTRPEAYALPPGAASEVKGRKRVAQTKRKSGVDSV